MNPAQPNVRFREEDLRRFSAASFDCNPMHLSPDYSRKTPAGERVVFGMLGALSCLGATEPPAGRSPLSVKVEFRSPLLLEIEYQIRVRQNGKDQATAILMDGSAVMMSVRLAFRDGVPQTAELSPSASAPRNVPRVMRDSDLVPGLCIQGSYSPGRSQYLDLLHSFGIDRGQWGDALPLTFVCASYLTGMELPGESATFTGLNVEFTGAPPAGLSHFQLTLGSYDERYRMVATSLSIGGDAGTYARGTMHATLRPPRRGPAAPAPGFDYQGRFAGKTALVVGASRGLGSALALQLVAAGGNVTGVYARSRDDAGALLEAARGLPGTLAMVQGDASDLDWCLEMRSRLAGGAGRLDLLVCNAAPPLHSLRMEPACHDRIQAYLKTGLALVSAPLAAFLELISASAGMVLLISSQAVENPVKAWPHYVALKMAAEGLVRTAALEFPNVTFRVERPGRIQTDLTNTPLGWQEAEDAAVVACRILQHAAGCPP